MRPRHAEDIFIPKLPKRTANGAYLTLSETLREPVSYRHSLRYLAVHAGIAVDDNDPDIIRNTVVEMLEGLGASPEADAAELRLRADRIYQAHGISAW